MNGAFVRLKSMVTAMTGRRRFALAAGLGALATAALPPLHVVILLVPAFTGLLWLVEGTKKLRSAFAVGWWFGFGHFVSGVYWTSISMLVKPEAFAWMIPFALFGLPATLAVFPAAAAVLTCVYRVGSVGRVLIFAASWTAIEWVRSWIFTGFPWNLIATAWANCDSMMQFAAFGGAYGLGLLTIIAAAMPTTLADGTGKRIFAPVIIAFAALGLTWGGGALRLAFAENGVVPDVRLRLVQPNIDQKLKWEPELRQSHVLNQMRMSAAPSTASPPTHIIWAETATPYYLADEPQLLALLSKAVPDHGLLITGAFRALFPKDKPSQVWNSLYAVDAEGKIAGTYDKFHLVPFGEYVPFRKVLTFAKLTEGRNDFTPGAGLQTLKLPGLPPVSPLICYEVIFPGQVANQDQRPAWMLNITNDGWYGRSSGPYQHFAAARMRAVEEGLPLVRVANTGISAVVDAYGRTRAVLGLGVSGVVDSELPVHLEKQTFYGRFGNGIVLVMLIGVLLTGILLSEKYQQY
ncbi:MAG: apolipoprotein N-acyltransferase [Rhodospirillales bacterium RIFCSPLOWO2_12_FULL_58_28]|nr:MAG: apolipoprotein N-acyltransferase [Rhodospirillales bacterium RIFCSPLOWO2_02_FULL_58_16]OHC77864.1 MAG: apolipoprotein N-acyltransferase [Rhodospirillales bacterium RIFCSPLOWO2_12_FULL_58_28]